MPVFKSDVREVSIVFRVIDRDNQPVGGLTPADIQIEDQGMRALSRPGRGKRSDRDGCFVDVELGRRRVAAAEDAADGHIGQILDAADGS